MVRPSLSLAAPLALAALLVGCGGDDPAWAVHHASVVPDATGLTGTQTWEFFTRAWERTGEADTLTCTRAQTLSATLVAAPEGCEGCIAAYATEVLELQTDCAEPWASDADYVTPRAIGIGDVPEEFADLDPYPGRSLGWYLSTDGVEMTFYGYAYDEALDWGGDLMAPGWQSGQAYTLWPAYAWDLQP